jgi:hypothetical protein
MNFFEQLKRHQAEMSELVDDLEAFAGIVVVCVFLYWAMTL